MEGLLVSRSVVGGAVGGKGCCQASWSPINQKSHNSGFSPFFTFGNLSNTSSSMSSSMPALDSCQSFGNLHESIGHQEVTALVHVQRDADLPCAGQFSTLSQDMAMGLILQAASGTGWTTGSGLEGPSNLFGLKGEQSLEETTEQPWPLLSKSPRRRMRVAFTCNVCGERTTRAINPHAYTDGTVFVQCAGCNIFHKLVDNLKLFHELKGSVFPTTVMYGNHSFGEHDSYDFLGLDDDAAA
ncbi:hypothetical protein GOP47_0028147 [Adiantum capillus-veneris]|nr:hypothetical protein GOP47_0028147 [Adiantum capillus-veneris]